MTKNEKTVKISTTESAYQSISVISSTLTSSYSSTKNIPISSTTKVNLIFTPESSQITMISTTASKEFNSTGNASLTQHTIITEIKTQEDTTENTSLSVQTTTNKEESKETKAIISSSTITSSSNNISTTISETNTSTNIISLTSNVNEINNSSFEDTSKNASISVQIFSTKIDKENSTKPIISSSTITSSATDISSTISETNTSTNIVSLKSNLNKINNSSFEETTENVTNNFAIPSNHSISNSSAIKLITISTSDTLETRSLETLIYKKDFDSENTRSNKTFEKTSKISTTKNIYSISTQNIPSKIIQVFSKKTLDMNESSTKTSKIYPNNNSSTSLVSISSKISETAFKETFKSTFKTINTVDSRTNTQKKLVSSPETIKTTSLSTTIRPVKSPNNSSTRNAHLTSNFADKEKATTRKIIGNTSLKISSNTRVPETLTKSTTNFNSKFLTKNSSVMTSEFISLTFLSPEDIFRIKISSASTKIKEFTKSSFTTSIYAFI